VPVHHEHGATAVSERLDAFQHRAKWAGPTIKIDGLDEELRVADLPSIGTAHEAPQLVFDSPASPGRLLLEGMERVEVAVGGKNVLDGGRAQSSDQLILEIHHADIETQLLHVIAGEIRMGTEPYPLKSASDHCLLAGVVQTGYCDVCPLRTELSKEAADRVRTTDGKDGDALSL
jgi:hypothetical protein